MTSLGGHWGFPGWMCVPGWCIVPASDMTPNSSSKPKYMHATREQTFQNINITPMAWIALTIAITMTSLGWHRGFPGWMCVPGWCIVPASDMTPNSSSKPKYMHATREHTFHNINITPMAWMALIIAITMTSLGGHRRFPGWMCMPGWCIVPASDMTPNSSSKQNYMHATREQTFQNINITPMAWIVSIFVMTTTSLSEHWGFPGWMCVPGRCTSKQHDTPFLFKTKIYACNQRTNLAWLQYNPNGMDCTHYCHHNDLIGWVLRVSRVDVCAWLMHSTREWHDTQFLFKTKIYVCNQGTNLSKHQYNPNGMDCIHYCHHNDLIGSVPRVSWVDVYAWLMYSTPERHTPNSSSKPKYMHATREQTFQIIYITPMTWNVSIYGMTTTSLGWHWGFPGGCVCLDDA
jgi:hypothetical protein